MTFSYRRAPTGVKLTATVFLLFAVLGLGIAALQIYVKTGLTVRGVLAHYRGDEAAFQTPMGFAELVEITHAHAFTMPMLAVTLGVAFALTQAAERLKQLVVMSLAVGVLLELGLPWVVRYGAPWTVHLFNVAGILLGGALILAVVVPLYEMWIARSDNEPSAHERGRL
jgi:hypothetical protein